MERNYFEKIHRNEIKSKSEVHAFFYKQHFYKQAETSKKLTLIRRGVSVGFVLRKIVSTVFQVDYCYPQQWQKMDDSYDAHFACIF